MGTGSSMRRRIGYITPGINDGNGIAIWNGIVEAAQKHDVDVIGFVGRELQHPNAFERAGNRVYDLIDTAQLDGLVVWASSLGNYLTRHDLEAFLCRFSPLPVVSIGVGFEGIPAVLVDSYGATRDIVTHLIETHGRRRIAYIRGPVEHYEAGERFRAYRDTLAAHGLPYDDALVYGPCMWLESEGASAVQAYLDERGVQFDAVVGASDYLALGALKALQARGIRVPDQVSVIGFDGTQVGRITTPPLASVKIRMRERGYQAGLMLIKLIDGEEVPSVISLEPRLVFRRSCGCLDAAVARAGRRSAAPPGLLSDEQHTVIVREMDQELEGVEESARRSQDLLDAYLEELSGGQPRTFITTLDAVLRQAIEVGSDAWAFQGAISALRDALLPTLPAEPETRVRAEDLWHQGRVLIGERSWRAQAFADFHASRQSDRLHEISRALAVASDVPQLMDILARVIPSLGISWYCIAVYDDAPGTPDLCRLLLAFDEEARLDLPPAGEPWPASQLATGGLLRGGPQRSLVVVPLHYGEEALGFAILDGSRCEGQVYRVLQEQVSSALKNVQLTQENLRLYRDALDAQQRAQAGQQMAEEASRLKSRFLSVVSHELRTPLVLLEGLSEMMLREGLGDRPPLPEPYRQDVARMSATAQQLGGLVRDVLDLARSQMGQLRLAMHPVDITDALAPVILVGEQMVVSKGLEWRADIAPGLPRIDGDPARLQQVALNLISNAAKFTAQGYVEIRITANDDRVIVSVSDSGLGVPVDEQAAIFDEFRQSERTATRGFGGLGVGLAICREIVMLHGGQIGVRSSGSEDGGSTFYFSLPALAEETHETVPEMGTEAAREPRDDRMVDGAPADRAGTVLVLTEQTGSGGQLAAYLTEHGFHTEILPVEVAAGCMERLFAAPPGVVVLDLPPTAERGWQLVDMLKHHPATQSVPVLLYALLAEQAAGSLLAMDYAPKPLGIEGLAVSLQRLGLAAPGPDDSPANGRASVANSTSDDRLILVADDDPTARALHCEIVRARFPAARIVTAANGRQALDAINADPAPMLVLLDMMMPEMGGLEVIEAMQGNPRTCDIPVIVLTAQCLDGEDMARLNHGVAAVLQKGVFSEGETLARIEQVLARTGRLGSETQRLVRKTLAYIHLHYTEPISREDMAGHAGVSVRHLTRCFDQEMGLTPTDYLSRYRITQAKQLLSAGEMSITEVMNAVGFCDSSYFAKAFRREVGQSPTAYRREAQNLPPRSASQ